MCGRQTLVVRVVGSFPLGCALDAVGDTAGQRKTANDNGEVFTAMKGGVVTVWNRRCQCADAGRHMQKRSKIIACVSGGFAATKDRRMIGQVSRCAPVQVIDGKDACAENRRPYGRMRGGMLCRLTGALPSDVFMRTGTQCEC